MCSRIVNSTCVKIQEKPSDVDSHVTFSIDVIVRSFSTSKICSEAIPCVAEDVIETKTGFGCLNDAREDRISSMHVRIGVECPSPAD